MIEMSVDDKKTVLPSEGPGHTSLPLPTQSFGKCTENPQESLKKGITEQDGTHNLAHQGSEEPVEHGNMENTTSQAAPDFSTQSQNGVQQQKSQPRLNKRRSTMNSSFKHPVFGKRRRRANSESESVLPSNFLLGGNIFDPLNLNSMLDEEVNRVLNAETPKSSPLPSKNRDPVEILIPRDITDPLNLNCSTTGDGGLQLTTLKSSGSGRRRHRNRHHGVIGVGGSGKGGEGGAVPQLGDLSETEKGQTYPVSQKESRIEEMALATSGPPLVCISDEVPIEEALELTSVPTQEAQCLSAQNSSSSSAVGGGAKDEMTTSAPVLETSNPAPITTVSSTAPSSHRQRKRKRTSSKSENLAAPNHDKNKGTGSSVSGGQPQGNSNQGTGFQPPQQHHPNQKKHQQQKNQHKPNQQHQKKKKFQYGNYDKYYGYRNPGLTEDPRLRTLKPKWFHGKEVLDLGCNTGRLTLSIALNWQPSRIVGLDIDGSLIHAAKKNIMYFLSEMHLLKARSGKKDESGDMTETPEKIGEEPAMVKDEGERNRTDQSGGFLEMAEGKEVQDGEKEAKEEVKVMEEELEPEAGGQMVGRSGDGCDWGQRDAKRTDEEAALASSASSSNGNCVLPVSLRISRGPIAAPPLPSPGNFPTNVSFVRGNYVLDSDLLLVTQREEFDVILCLSVTKWIHLNWGDAGLKRLFHRVYRHLRPSGLFILEPQPWNSYGKRKKLSETISKNYYNIRLKPEQFSSYLTSEVGFSSYELIGTSNNQSKGFQRPIYVFYKGPAPH